MDVFKKALLCVSLLLISSNAFSTAYYLDNYYYKRINNSHAEFDTKEEASENGCALYGSYSYDINIGTYYSENGPLAGLVYTYNTTCLNHPYPGSRGWTIHTDYHVCPAATEGNAEYDEIGCGCSGDGTESLFDGEEGGEEGCKPISGAGSGGNGGSGDGGDGTGGNGNGGTGSGSGGNNGGNGGDGQDPNNPDGPDGEGPDKTGGCKKGDAESDQTENPCQISTGAKFRNEMDFTSSSLSLVRHYNSLSLVDRGFGKGWHSAYFKQLEVTADSLTVFEGNGRGETWTKVGGVWQGDADSDYLITETSTGFTVTLKRGDVHEYNLAGLLLSETDTQGKVTTYEYDAQDRLTTVTHYYGQSITFEYSTDGKNHITKVTDTSGVEYGYEYDANDNLIAVIYPDLTSDTSDNPRRIYHYEDSRFPNNITGITNVDGDRYATFSYNADGRAIESALAPTTNSVGQERVQLEYTGHGSNNSSGSN